MAVQVGHEQRERKLLSIAWAVLDAGTARLAEIRVRDEVFLSLGILEEDLDRADYLAEPTADAPFGVDCDVPFLGTQDKFFEIRSPQRRPAWHVIAQVGGEQGNPTYPAQGFPGPHSPDSLGNNNEDCRGQEAERKSFLYAGLSR